MSLIGLLTATEKPVCSLHLHMRPIQWHLNRHWHVPEVLEKVILILQTLHPPLAWWLDETNVLKGQLLLPFQHALHLGDSTARGVWSPMESLLHINYLELKAVLLALKAFKHLCRDQIVLVASDNTTVVSYINKKTRGYEVRLSLCPPLETPVMVPPQGNCSETQSSDSDRVVPISAGVCSLVLQMGQTSDGLACNPVQSQTAPVCFTGTGSDSLFGISVDSTVGAPGSLRFSPVSLLPQVISKLRDQGCRRMILIAPGWPNMPWFWDLVDLLVQIPFRLPLTRDLVTQPFNGLLHRNLSNLHAWLLESLTSRNTGSLIKWQQELRLLREAQPEPFTSQSGPFFVNGGSHTRWTSGRPL